MKADIFNLVSLLLDTDSKLTAEIRIRDSKMFFSWQSKSLAERHGRMFKLQKQLENNFYCSKISISFWTKNKVQERVDEYTMRSNDLEWLLSIIRLHSIMKNGKKNEIRKKVFQDIEKLKKDIEVKEIL